MHLFSLRSKILIKLATFSSGQGHLQSYASAREEGIQVQGRFEVRLTLDGKADVWILDGTNLKKGSVNDLCAGCELDCMVDTFRLAKMQLPKIGNFKAKPLFVCQIVLKQIIAQLPCKYTDKFDSDSEEDTLIPL